MFFDFKLTYKLLKSPYLKDYIPFNLPFLVSPETTEKLTPIEVEIQQNTDETKDYCLSPEIALVDHLVTNNFLKSYDKEESYYSIVPCLIPNPASGELAVQHFLVFFSVFNSIEVLATDLCYSLKPLLPENIILTWDNSECCCLENSKEETIAVFIKERNYQWGAFDLGAYVNESN